MRASWYEYRGIDWDILCVPLDHAQGIQGHLEHNLSFLPANPFVALLKACCVGAQKCNAEFYETINSMPNIAKIT